PYRFSAEPGVSSASGGASIDGTSPRTRPAVVEVQALPSPLGDPGYAAEGRQAAPLDPAALESQSASAHDAQAAMPPSAAPSRPPCAEPRRIDALGPALRGPGNGLAWCVFAAVTALALFAIASSVAWVATRH
ncbi:MAG: hypothetical protein MUF54_03825, partial [Polyangiaceae bacterium]|nr:hypothetical protein [Polyangiaceae bacterium]